jgi:hypothetical protein
MNGPIFIGGSSRSGKTLMRWLLSSHPRIALSRRTEMWDRYAGRFGDLAKSENLDRCLDAMLARPQIAALSIDPAALRRDFATGPHTYARLFALAHEQYAERNGKARWGDQSPGIERFADRLVASYAGARILHLVRDPRDAYHAETERGVRGPGAVGSFTAAWGRSAELAARNGGRYPDASMLVRYEDLVTEPADTMRAVCRFIGERFEPSMLRLDGVDRYREVQPTGGTPISSAFVGSYRANVDRCELAYIQSVVHEPMQRLGYRPDPIRLTTAERVRCLAVWPLGIARVGLRRTADVVQHRRESDHVARGDVR